MPDGWWHPRLCWVIWRWLVHHGFIKWETNSRISFAAWAWFLRYNIRFLVFLLGPTVLLAFLLMKFLLSWIFNFVICDSTIRFWKSILALRKLVLCFTHLFICISVSLFALHTGLAFDRLSWQALRVRFHLKRCFFYFFKLDQLSVVLVMVGVRAEGRSLGWRLALNVWLVSVVLGMMITFSHSLLFHFLRLEMLALIVMTSTSRIFLRSVSQLVLVHV